MHWSSAEVLVSPRSSLWVTRPVVASWVSDPEVVCHLAPAPSSREVHDLVEAVPVRLAVTVPQVRTFFAVSLYQGRLTDLASTLPPGAE